MAGSEDVAVAAAVAQDHGLRRNLGSFGLLWVSVSSIIGSGWLFSALFAAQVADPAALVGWGIGTAAVLALALVLAELGGMFSVSGGTTRYPRYAFGSVAGFAMGWFSWLAGVTVAPIEVEAALQYLSAERISRRSVSGCGRAPLKQAGLTAADAALRG